MTDKSFFGLSALFALTLLACGTRFFKPVKVHYYLYATSGSSAQVNSYEVDIKTGKLTAIESYSNLGSSVNHLLVHPKLNVIYLEPGNGVSQGIYIAQLDSSNGKLSLLDHPSTSAGIAGMTISRNGNFLFSAHTNSMTSWSINSTTGVLTQVGSLSFSNTTQTLLKSDPLVDVVYSASNGDHLLRVINVSDPAQMSTTAQYDWDSVSIGSPATLSVHPSLSILVVAGGIGGYRGWSQYRLNSTTLDLTLTDSLYTFPSNVSFAKSLYTPDGKYLLMNANGLRVYSVDTALGKLTDLSSTTPVQYGLVMHKDLPYVYAGNTTSDTIEVFQLDSSSGALTSVQSVTGITNPNSMIIVKAISAI